MRIDLVPELPPSGGYGNLVTAMDLFYTYLFAYPTSSHHAKTIAIVIINVMTEHGYLPSTIISDNGSVFMSQVIKDLAKVLVSTLQHAAKEYAQTIAVLERTHFTQGNFNDWNR